MDPHPGTQPKRWSRSRRRGSDATRSSPEAPAGPAATPSEPAPPLQAPETADIYRSLFNNLRRAFGGTIDDSNADAIAFAASELYHKDVEPRLWEQKTAQEILDSFGVPRAGAFTRYSLADRLLLLRRSASPDRTAQAEVLLTELGAPEAGQDGSRLSIKERIEALLEGVESLPPPVKEAATTGDASASEGNGPPPEQLVDALQTLRDAARSGDTDDPNDGSTAASNHAPQVDAPAAELVGLGTLIAGMQEELIRLRQAVETVQSRLDETLQLLRAGTGGVALPPSAPVGEPLPALLPAGAAGVDAPPDGDRPAAEAAATEAQAEPESEGVDLDAGAAAPEAAGPDEAVLEAAEPDEVVDPGPGGPPALEPGPDEIAAADDVTQVVPVVAGGTVLEEPPVSVKRRRSLPKLLVIAVILGLLVAGVAIAISTVGWNEVRDKLNIGSVGLLAGLAIQSIGAGYG